MRNCFESSKRERRLAHKGKGSKIDEQRKANFDLEYPHLAALAQEYDA
ncbi:MAG: hypothetical protein WCA10_13400 [Terracidiphilus sp.]